MKAHILTSAVPLAEGMDYFALCGKQVSHAAWVRMQDTEFMGGTLVLAGTCLKCREKGITHRYIYFAINGEESRHV